MGERVRFSPAPTGSLHIGGARTALVNWLVARKSGGSLILRIEDTDASSVVPSSEEAIVRDLTWLGIAPDEGPGIGGPVGPYRQSERSERYGAALDALVRAGVVYPCFCTREELAIERTRAIEAGRPPRYGGRCREVAPAEARARIIAGVPHAWRFSVPGGRSIRFTDLVHGRVSFATDAIGDFIVVRSDGSATYDLACVVDDLDMGITTVIRGDDHLSNTARQLLLIEALEAAAPRYAHLPLVCGPGGSPLSKSAGDTGIGELERQGYLASAVVHHLALLGWSDPTNARVLTLEMLVERFDLERVSRAPAVHDPARLRALNAAHLRALDEDAFVSFVERFAPHIPDDIERGILLEAVREEATTGSEAGTLIARVVERPTLHSCPSPDALRVALEVLGSAWDRTDAAQRSEALKAALRAAGIPLREGLHAVREALTGAPDGLPVAKLLAVLGRDESLVRLERSLAASVPESRDART